MFSVLIFRYFESYALFSFFGDSATGAGMDIVVSSVRAYVNALNKMLSFKNQTGVVVNSENSQVSV